MFTQIWHNNEYVSHDIKYKHKTVSTFKHMITPLYLNIALILDCSGSNITYKMSSPHCGMVTLSSRPSYPVNRFNQQNVDSGEVYWTHSGHQSTTGYQEYGSFSLINTIYLYQISQVAGRTVLRKHICIRYVFKSPIIVITLISLTSSLE